VLFCDLVGSTAIAGQLDPEQWRETVAGYHRAAAEAIVRFDGYVAKFLGDGVMALFGWPQAHDNDAERGARAGLAILDAIEKLNEQPGHAKLSARVGIDSGPVVVGKGAGNEIDVFGDPPNIAARVESVAEPGTVAITDATQRLVSGLFIVEERGAQALKGIERPLQVYRVIRPSGARGRFDVATAAGGLTSFVGREDELRSLMNRWERALDGEGQVALIVGEAGIGKSRLVQRFREQITGTPHTWVEAGAGAFFQNTPFYPVTEMLRQMLGEIPAENQLEQLAPRLTAAGLKPADALPLIAPILNLLLPLEYPPSTLAPEQQRRRLLATLVEWVLGSARAQSLVIATEDLHWADPSTLELIQLLVEQGATARLLLLYTARPEFQAPWPMRAHHAQINLNRLTSANVRTMVAQVAAKIALSHETIATVVERTGGVPLFVEELTRAVLESGNAKLTGHEIPATLHDSLMARLDRLGPAKELIQVGAVIGSEFSYELIHAVYPIAEGDLQGALRRLTDAELLYVRGIAPEAAYQFKHALIRDAAYEALLKSRRKELHLIVARTIDEKFPTLKETHPEVLARHWTEAGETEPAIAEWSRAGDAAQARNAFREAQESYQQALTLLGTLPASPDRDGRELELVSTLAQVLTVTRGHTAPETRAAAERARDLAEKGGNLAQLVLQVFGIWHSRWFSGDLSTASLLADRLLDLAEREGSPSSFGLVCYAQVTTSLYRGDLVGAEEHFARWGGFLEAAGLKLVPGAAAVGIAMASFCAGALGRADIARERIAQALAFAGYSNNPYALAAALGFESELSCLLREPQRAEVAATQALAIVEEHGFTSIGNLIRPMLGWARAQLGHTGESVALVRQALAGLAEAGSRAGITIFLTLLAEAQALEGLIDEALVTIEEALQANPEELVFRPNAMTCRGELRLKVGQTALAEADFREAIALAQSMCAKSWELRATMSLARLLAKQGRRDEARTMLAEIYNWFTEGFDTADLKDAKALLDELNA